MADTIASMTSSEPLVFPAELQAPGTAASPWEALARLDEIGESGMARVSRGDLDVLIAATPQGVVATEDRCPHMSAPLSAGSLEDCVVACPLHRGRFDLRDGSTVTFPTTGGLDADGTYVPTWAPPDSEPKPPPSDVKAQARALTRTRRIRYYPVRIIDGVVEVRLPR